MNYKTSLSKIEIERMRNAGAKILLIDVRSESEFAEGHVPDAVNIAILQIESADFSIERNGTEVIVTVCAKGGGRSERAADLLRQLLHEKVYFLEGGTLGWFGKI